MDEPMHWMHCGFSCCSVLLPVRHKISQSHLPPWKTVGSVFPPRTGAWLGVCSWYKLYTGRGQAAVLESGAVLLTQLLAQCVVLSIKLDSCHQHLGPYPVLTAAAVDDDVASLIPRDQPNSRQKMHDFTAEFLKCVKFHEKFTERVSEIHGPHRRYFKVVC